MVIAVHAETQSALMILAHTQSLIALTLLYLYFYSILFHFFSSFHPFLHIRKWKMILVSAL